MDCSEDNNSSDEECANRLLSLKDKQLLEHTILEDKAEDCCSSEDDLELKKPLASLPNMKETKTFKNFDVISPLIKSYSKDGVSLKSSDQRYLEQKLF